MNQILHYLPYVFLFAAATALIYGWGLWRAMRQKQDLSNLLSSKGVSAIRRSLRKKGPLALEELEPGRDRSESIFKFPSSLYDPPEADYGRKGKRTDRLPVPEIERVSPCDGFSVKFITAGHPFLRRQCSRRQ